MPAAPPKARALLALNLAVYFALAILPVLAMALHWRPIRLEGVRAPVPRPALTFRDLRHERFQTKADAWFQRYLGLVGASIRIDNAILFHVFAETKMGATVRVGDDGVLFIDDDINYFNKAGVAVTGAPFVDELAARIATLQRSLAARGRAMVPVIVPSKTSIYRDAVPAQWTATLGTPRPTDVETYQGLVRAFAAHGVAYVDGRALVERRIAAGTPRRDLWRPEGRHWTRYAACLTVAEVTRVYGELSGKPQPPLECRLKMVAPGKDPEDLDLLRLLNALFVQPTQPRVATVEPHPPAPASAEPLPKALMIATSFGWTLTRELQESHRWSSIFMNYYNSTLHEVGGKRQAAVQPGDPLWREASFDRDLYVLDLFEGYLMGDNYVDQFLHQAEAGILAGEKP